MKYPDDYINKVICGDCLKLMKQLPAGAIDMIISSPPYNVGIDYGIHKDNMSQIEYESFTEELFHLMFLSLRVGGRLAWNVPSFSSRNNLYELTLRMCRKVGFHQYAEIVWDKKQISSRTAWGSFCSPNLPNILPRHEYVLVFYKDIKEFGKGESGIEKENFIKWTDGMWELTPETDLAHHPAPYPLELPKRIIQMFTSKNSIILDPFLGSGTTALAAKELNRRYIGFEINPEFCAIANRRLAQGYLFT